jgi:hypothetical protein
LKKPSRKRSELRFGESNLEIVMIRGPEKSNLVMEEVTDPVELAQGRHLRERFDRNWAWLEAHIPEVYDCNRGKVICISGEEVFAADTAEEALTQAKNTHPEDEGRFTLYVPREKMARIYAHQWFMAPMP